VPDDAGNAVFALMELMLPWLPLCSGDAQTVIDRVAAS
jgi:hypothetical protein